MSQICICLEFLQMVQFYLSVAFLLVTCGLFSVFGVLFKSGFFSIKQGFFSSISEIVSISKEVETQHPGEAQVPQLPAEPLSRWPRPERCPCSSPERKQPCEKQPSSPHAKSNYVKDTGRERALRGPDQKPETREAGGKTDQIRRTFPSLRIRNGAFWLINSTPSKFKPKSPEGNKEKAINNNSNHFTDAPV